jgi:hypothetical protein
VTGRHRSEAQNGGRSWLRSAVWLLLLAGIVLAVPVVLGLLAFGIYEARTHQSDAYPVEVALGGTAWAIGCSSVILTLPRTWPRSPAEMVSLVDNVLWLAMGTGFLLVVIGSRQGWANGPLGVVLISFSIPYALYKLAGERLLRTFLEARAASRPHPS